MRPRKRFGQHFLHDTAILQAIADAMALAPQQRVFEIGPGQGALTQYLHRPDLQRYLAVEIDRDLAPLLPAKFPGIEVLQQDILRTDMVEVLGKDAQPTQPHTCQGGRRRSASGLATHLQLLVSVYISRRFWLVVSHFDARLNTHKYAPHRSP